MIKYVASDLDGTLLKNEAQTLNSEVFALIRKLKEKGIRFIAASGRQYDSLYRLFEPVKDDISYIAENGSLCIHDHKVISRGIIDRELGIRIIKATRQIPECHCMLSCESTAYTDSTDQKFLDYMHNFVKFKIKEVPDLLDIKEPFLKFAVFNFNGTDTMEPFFKEQFSSEITVVTSGNLWVDFIVPNANKGSGLASITRHLGISLKDGIAFGDQFNDIELLEAAGIGYAMKDCAPGVEKYADRQTESVESILRELL
ncbi:MAG: HAD family hydrolase [Dorea sp.]|nr:HAD family hydrolase [Dorea sp.]